MALGCATHSYVVQDRDGGVVASAGTLTNVRWSRVLNDASTAAVVIGTSGPDCCGQLGNIRSWRHQLVIFRNDSSGSTLVWSGLIVNVDWLYDSVAIDAIDIIGLLDRRVPHQDFTFTGTDVTEIARQLVEDGFAPDDPGHTTTVIGAAGVTGGRTYEENIGQTADHLRDLADSGLDFTAVGSNVVILPDDFCDVVGRLSDDDLSQGLTVSEDGASLATRVIVEGSDDSGVVGVAGGVNSYYGLLERYSQQTTIDTAAGAQQAAAARLRSSLAVPVFIDTQDVTLAPTANVEVAKLVPGWCLDVTSDITCRTITQRLKITGLQVTEDGEQERILVQVAATGDELEVT
jgi:hypothetical protein